MPTLNQDEKDRITNEILSSIKPLDVVSMETGVPLRTLEMWRAQAMAKSARALGWTPRKMLEVLSGAINCGDNIKGRNEWLREKKVSLMEFNLWSIAAEDALRAFGQVKLGGAKATRLRISALERDLRKKDKAMANAAAQFWNGYGDTDQR
ncbi:transposase [Paraburkholderia sp. JPY465]|uniref:hypothetical protein n=1 Tax=Paraburkholderia sp. JPY465 TaxID=3042285 RepID=UPI003D1AD379